MEENNIEGEKYGNYDDLEKIMDEYPVPTTAKGIYEVLLKQKVMKRESLIPSRSEKRNPGIKFKCSWGNLLLVKSVNPVLKYFAWCCIQDMVVVGERKHRRNQDKNCHMEITNQITGELTECGVRESLRHAMWECQVSSSKFIKLREILGEYLEREITNEQILFLSFNNRNKKKLKMGIWITVNCLYFIYNKRTAEVSDMLEEMKKELFWHLMLERWIAGRTAFNQLYGIIDRMVDDY